MNDYLPVGISKSVYELSLAKGGPNNFRFLELFDTAEDEAIYLLRGYIVYRFTTCCYVGANLSKMSWSRGSFE